MKLKEIEELEEFILINSIIYYDFDTNIVSDHVYDRKCQELVELIQSNKNEFEHSKYYYCYYDFDGSTGFDLRFRLLRNHLEELVEILESKLNRKIDIERLIW